MQQPILNGIGSSQFQVKCRESFHGHDLMLFYLTV
jgi:hypothetical protein